MQNTVASYLLCSGGFWTVTVQSADKAEMGESKTSIHVFVYVVLIIKI